MPAEGKERRGMSDKVSNVMEWCGKKVRAVLHIWREPARLPNLEDRPPRLIHPKTASD